MQKRMIRPTLLLTALLTSTISMAQPDLFFAQSMQQTLSQSPMSFRVSKNIPSQYRKFSADLVDQIGTVGKSMGQQLAVQINALPRQGATLQRQLSQIGINAKQQVGDTVLTMVNPAQLNDISALSSVQDLRIQGENQLIQDPMVSDLLRQIGIAQQQDHQQMISQAPTEPQTSIQKRQDSGVHAMKAQLLHQQGLTGKGLKVGIIDFGYGGYATLMQQGVVPRPVNTMTFNKNSSSSTLSMGSADTPHGAACAEIVHHVAPQAALYLAQVGPGNGSAIDQDILGAIDWMVSQGVHIINFSGGGHFHQHDGTSLLDQKIAEVAARNILWVNAAGNEHQEIWTGTLVDRNNNGRVDVDGTSVDAIFFKKEENSRDFHRFMLNWDDWQGSKQSVQNIDVQAFLFMRDPSTGQAIKIDELSSPRNPGTAPLKNKSVQLQQGEYAIALVSNQLSGRKVRIYINDVEMQHKTAHTIGIPATAAEALSVGAWDVKTQAVATYSGRGPTDDGRTKPDLIAPTNTENQAYAAYDFPTFQGTSASSPYAAGFAALIWQNNRNWSATQLKSFLVNQATRGIGQRPNIEAGYGLLDAKQVLTHLSSGSRSSTSDTPPAAPAPTTEPSAADVQNLLNRLGIVK